MRGDIGRKDLYIRIPYDKSIYFNLMENYYEISPKVNTGTDGRKHNIAQVGKTYRISFSCVTSEKLLGPYLDNQLHNSLPP